MTLKTLNSTTQNGAQLHIALLGKAEDVQREAYLLSNYGIASLPDDYRDGQDDAVTLSSNLYRLGKYARACALASIAAGGRKGARTIKTALAIREAKHFAKVREMLRVTHLPLCPSPARELSIAGNGRADSWEE